MLIASLIDIALVDLPMVHKRIHIVSFPEKEWWGEKKNTPLWGDLKVTAYKQSQELYQEEQQRSIFLVEPDSFYFKNDSDLFFTRASSRVFENLDLGDKTLNINFLGHGCPKRDTQIIRAIYDALTTKKTLAEVIEKTMELEHIVIELYGCHVDKDYQYGPFWVEVKKLIGLGIPLVIAFGGVNELLTTGQFMHSQLGYSDKLDDVMSEKYDAYFSHKLAKYSIATFNGAEVVSMRCDFGYINKFQRKQKQTFLMLCPQTGRGVWASGSKNWWDTTNMRYGISAPRICFYQPFIRSSSGIPKECGTMTWRDFPYGYMPKFLKNNM